MATNELASEGVDEQRSSVSRRTDSETCIDGFFCRCGTLREPTDSNGLVCPNGCRPPASGPDCELVSTTYQQQREDLTVVEGDELEAVGSVEFTRTEHCESCDESREVKAHVAQVRSADEPPTRQYTCAVCGHSWREEG